jgi:hypothetical protein
MYLLLSEEVTQATAHSARESSILQQTTISLVSKRVEVGGPFGMGPKTGLRKVSLQVCFHFLIAATIAGVAKTGSLSQVRLRLGSG